MSVAMMKERFRKGPPTMVSVHRAAWGPAPENSIPAIRAATSWDVIEVDVALDADGTAFLMHDDTLNRMTGEAVATDGVDADRLADLTLRQGAGGTGAPITDHHIPRLAEAFAAIEGTRAIFDLDVKRPADVPAVAAQVAEIAGQAQSTVKIGVGSLEDIVALKTLEDAHGVMVMAKVDLKGADDLEVIRALHDMDQAVVEVWFDDLDLLSKACRIGDDSMRLGTYTLDPVHCCGLSDARALNDPAAVWGRLIDAGIGQIMTDQAPELSDYLAQRNP